MSDIIKKTLYLNEDITYTNNLSIIEYDMKDAGMSIIKELSLLDSSTIEKLSTMKKEERNITIGKMMRKDAELSKAINGYFAVARELFYTANNLKDGEILSIKKDAIFLLNKRASKLKVGNFIEFAQKNSYTSFINIEGIEMYYDSERSILDIKNLKSSSRKQLGIEDITEENTPILKDIKMILRSAERLDSTTMIGVLRQYRKDYINKNLDIDRYINIHTGCFDVVYGKARYSFQILDSKLIDNLDITQNYINFILPIIREII